MIALPPDTGPASPGAGPVRRRYQTGKHLEAFLLLLVAERPDHGGSLLTRLREIVPDAFTIDSGQTYRVLRDLERQGALASTWSEQADGGTPLRLYRLTDRGLVRLRAWHDDIEARHASLATFLRRYEEGGLRSGGGDWRAP